MIEIDTPFKLTLSTNIPKDPQDDLTSKMSITDLLAAAEFLEKREREKGYSDILAHFVKLNL